MIPNTAIITIAVGVLVILTNALTEVIKGIVPKIPAQITATIIALVLTIGTVCAYLSITGAALSYKPLAGGELAA